MSEKNKQLLKNQASSDRKQELSKRKREIFFIFALSILLAFLIGVEVYIFRSGQNLPSSYVLFFIGLVNVNLILVLLLLFLIFRNVVKVFIERRSKIFGSSLKSKLIVSFVSFSVIPTLLVFIISVFYLNSSFEKWFSQRMLSVLRNASEVIDTFIANEKKRGYEYARLSIKQVKGAADASRLNKLEQIRALYKLDAIEYYDSLVADRLVSQDPELNSDIVPSLNFEFLQRGLVGRDEASIIQIFGDYNLLRLMVPVDKNSDSGVIVVTKFLNLTPGSKFDDIVGAYQEFHNNSLVEYPLKSIYFIMLIVMTLVILFAAVWFGFYLARQLSIPLVQLGRATKRVAAGDYSPLEISSGSEEISSLIGNFNQMITNLSSSELELQQTLKNLNQYTRYVEIVLKNVSAGVISVDMNGQIATMNRRAGELLQVDPTQFTGKHIRTTMSDENYKLFSNIVKFMQENSLMSLQKEQRIQVGQDTIPLSIHISLLVDENKAEIGRIMVFDDMTPIVNAQRAAAWTEVARRIAHEIKNPLTPIRLAAERIAKKFGGQIQDPAFSDSIKMIVNQVDDMRLLVNEFSQFARLPQIKPVPAQINDVVKNTAQIYVDNHPQVAFDISLDSTLPEFKFDPDQIRRVLVNLIENAIDAVHKDESPQVKIYTHYDSRLKVLKISISDNGVGIPHRDRVRIFEPYYSTKEKGTGLGLPIVKSIIEDHSGVIRALENSPKGTSMVIELPIIPVDSV
ncbi:MAG: PAS domain-containing sensor histidine kinase [Bdellovibrionales bacterium RIFCSPHIGHO2_01_FULL_40_29]|nr:MAG: PAS domain-containing sensor histidine kinase [Bdellovibrionales bacterium RIFCSPHIGHO2_01_FULL_40_29]OFZ33937.1 MAG: PAS domain-containing sensor histidine kinase [Bdellovibrionales bacterium RIFCSPHIGHO2_02_FULL_40_15]